MPFGPTSNSGSSFGSLGGIPSNNVALAEALAAKLDKVGGAMTGALTLQSVVLSGASPACLKLGADHGTTPTHQTIVSHSVTTGTGANLVLAGGTGSVAGGATILAASDTTGAPGPIVAAMPGSKIAFFGTGGSVQINTGIFGEMHAPGMGTAVDDSSTFGGYTIGQIVGGLRALGLFN